MYDSSDNYEDDASRERRQAVLDRNKLVFLNHDFDILPSAIQIENVNISHLFTKNLFQDGSSQVQKTKT